MGDSTEWPEPISAGRAIQLSGTTASEREVCRFMAAPFNSLTPGNLMNPSKTRVLNPSDPKASRRALRQDRDRHDHDGDAHL
jgi:hypothetical protein